MDIFLMVLWPNLKYIIQNVSELFISTKNFLHFAFSYGIEVVWVVLVLRLCLVLL